MPNPKEMMKGAIPAPVPEKKKKKATYKGEKMPLSEAVDKAFKNLGAKKRDK